MTARAAPETTPGVAVRGLSVRAGDRILVSDIDLEITAGVVVAVMGPSGAGKSTIAAAVAGVAIPGLVREGVVTPTPGCRIGYLPQDAAATLNPARRIGAALGELAIIHGRPPRGLRARRRWRAERVQQLLAQAAFPVDANHRRIWPRRFPFQFSGGQRTRLALAQVLACDPDVLVLDEPSTGLDTVSRRLIVKALDGLRSAGVAILLVTHDAHVAAELGDRVLVVRDGRICENPSSAADHVGSPAAVELAGPPATDPPVLGIGHLDVDLAGTAALRQVNLAVNPGELICLVGPSGSGKSTLVRAVAGLTPISGGSVCVDGATLPRLSRRTPGLLADVQYVPQEVRESFEPDRPVIDQVMRTAIRLRRQPADRARDDALRLLSRLGLDESVVSRLPQGLSGGQLRRAALARSVIAEPRILVCDEVTTGLEPELIALIVDVLDAERARRGAAIILATHDLRAVLPRCDRVVVLDEGRITDDLPTGRWDKSSPVLAELLAADGIS